VVTSPVTAFFSVSTFQSLSAGFGPGVASLTGVETRLAGETWLPLLQPAPHRKANIAKQTNLPTCSLMLPTVTRSHTACIAKCDTYRRLASHFDWNGTIGRLHGRRYEMQP